MPNIPKPRTTKKRTSSTSILSVLEQDEGTPRDDKKLESSISKKQRNSLRRSHFSEAIGRKKYDISRERMPEINESSVIKLRSTLSEIRTEKHIPSGKTFQGPSTVEEIVGGKPDDQLLDTDFPKATFDPKVQLQYIVKPGCLPRMVEVERLRRAYLKQDLEKILMEKGIDDKNLIMLNEESSIVRTEKGVEFTPFLPVELFDNDDLEIRSPDAWLSRAIVHGVRKALPGKAYLPTPSCKSTEGELQENHVTCSWQDVGVLDYNESRRTWLVQTLNKKGRVFNKDETAFWKQGLEHFNKSQKLSSSQWWIPRLRLKFIAEDAYQFADRINAALKARDEAEQIIRYWLCVDGMPTDGMSSLDDEAVNRIITRVSNNSALKKWKDLPQELAASTEDAKESYRQCMNRLLFDHLTTTDPELIGVVNIPSKPNHELKISTMPDLVPYSLSILKRKFIFRSFLVFKEAIWTLYKIREECNKPLEMNLFVTNNPKSVKLEEFEQIQAQATQQVHLFLKDSWGRSIIIAIRGFIQYVGKGWFNLNETNWQIYQMSKLKKFMTVVRFMMQDTLRFLVLSSLRSFVQFFLDACKDIIDLPENYKWSSDLKRSPIKPKRYSIFVIDLIVDATGVRYSSDFENFETALQTLFVRGINATDTVQDVEKFVLTSLYWHETPMVDTVRIKEAEVVELQELLIRVVNHSFIPLRAYAHQYQQFLTLAKQELNHYIEAYDETADLVLMDIKWEIDRLIAEKNLLEHKMPKSITIGPFVVIVEASKLTLVKKCKMLADGLIEYVTKKIRKRVEDVTAEFKRIFRKLQDKPLTLEEIGDIRSWINSIPATMATLSEQGKNVCADFSILDFYLRPLNEDDFTEKASILTWPAKIHKQIQQCTQMLIEEEEKFARLLIIDQANHKDRLENLMMAIAGLSSCNDISRAAEYANEIKRLIKNLRECQDLAVAYNRREMIIGVPITSYEIIAKMVKLFDPYRNLWLTASDWQRWFDSWMTDPVFSIDPDALEKNVADASKTMTKLLKAFAEAPDQLNIVTDIKNQIESFKPSVPLIQAIRNPGMRPRHWEQLSHEIGIKVIPKPNLSFAKCLDLGLGHHTQAVIAIGESAAKELQIETGLDKMELAWADIRMDIVPYKSTGTYQLKINEEIQQLLDDQIVNTQTMTFSPFKKPFEARLTNWESKLKLVQEVLDQWLSAQRSWMYLEPIFSADGIVRQLPMEGKKYQQMERHWKRIMNNASKNTDILSFCHDTVVLNNLLECNSLLEKVTKGLTDYLEIKRSAFPRFYFLSDDELLEILSQTKNPLAVQPHLRKCFEAFAKLDFGPDLRIRGVQSFEGEQVTFTTKLYPVGGVEEWMSNLEDTMVESIRDILSNALVDYAKNPRKDFVLIWPGQIVIAICQTYWTSEVEQGLNGNTLEDYLTLMYDQLDDLRELVRGELHRNERYTLSALIVIEVHSRDVVQGMVEDKVTGVKDFDWIRQLRYYWVNSHLYVRAVNAEFRYCYEYLGNTGRLVITPLTDRCYLTLLGALHLKFGGAPAGPAGTGKTETTKDLSKAMAIACVVFNCSDQLDYLAMGKFFKGLASSGAWACFDEFNRIDLEVLSVIAQQLQTINKAIVAKAKRFMFEGCEITLKETCASFVTMNPGYAGRSELPDNLKALFRPVAMMVPDYALIAEISFFSFGFSNSRHLARKVTTTFKLASEQVSSQDHYDFGMRAVKTVIYAAGNLKREHPKMNEELIALRAIRDVNVPKFLQDDLKLFAGIVSDLFPSTPDEPIDYGKLEDAIRNACKEQFLKDVDGFVVKCIQLYDTTIVRHGLMLVGPAGSGKTKCNDVLKMAINELVGELNPGGTSYQVVHSISLNPKSITMGQLYGEFDSITYEWTDGILPSLIRNGAIAQDDDKRWYIFDGPVDAVWIENMNSVLDDNKKLCLTSGEIIKLSDNQTLMFEVADLSVASPATVSRCGMIYLEPSILGLRPFVDCWIEFKLPANARLYIPRLNNLFNAFLEPAIQFMRFRTKEIVVSMNSNVTFSLMKLLGCLLRKLPPPHLVPETKFEEMEALVECLFIFALIWSVGATCDNDGRHRFNSWLRQKMSLEQLMHEFPVDETIYDYRVDDGTAVTNITGNIQQAADAPPFQIWISWLTNLPSYIILPTMKFGDILVPTPDTIRNTFVLEALLTNNFPVLAIGPTGTGKSATIKDKLSRGLSSTYMADFINFSARTSANQVQDLIDHKLDKRRKGIFGPAPGKIFIFFVDDMNMPAVEVYGAQPPIELLRQFMDYSGWYDRRSIGEFRRLVDVNFICAMGPPGGGRNTVTQRFLRHFSYLSYTDLEDNSMKRIFQTILQSWLEPNPEMFQYSEQMVRSSITVYNTITTQLLPTPTKSHYTFNLRDVSKVFQGILMTDPLVLQELPAFLRLWYHETSRVYQDRLVNNEDRTWFQKLMDLRMQEDFDVPFDLAVMKQPVLYADFLSTNHEKKVYEEITDIDRLIFYLEEMLEDYNDNNVQQMNLVLFTDAIRHVCRIGRILKQPGGNGLLLGMGGSGRQSLTRLAAHLNEMECFQIELAKQYGMVEWREDLKKVMVKSGLKDRNVVFLFSDTQIKSEAFLEDINNILNSGDVPNIFGAEDLELIYQTLRQATVEAGLVPSKSNMYTTLTKRVRANLHTFITMSPIGEIFRARLRQFPALVNCCTIDWFSEWPDAALLSVGMNFLQEMPNLEADDKTIRGAVAMCQLMHQTTISASERFFLELSRYNYVTPKSYLDLLAAFTVIHRIKCQTLKEAKIRMQTGLIKLKQTSDDIGEMQIELEKLRPALVIAAKETDVMRKKIAIDTAIAEETKIVVKKEEESASEIAATTQAITDDAQKDLDLALPALDAALSSLKNLNKNDVVELRSMKSPPAGIRLVMEAVCILKGVKPKLYPGEKPGTKVADYWEPSKVLLQDPTRFLESLFKFDKDNISEDIIRKILPYIEDPAFLPEAIAKVSKACTSICMWVRAMHKYSEVTKVVVPKREALAKAQAQLAVTMEILAEAKGRLDLVESGLNSLNQKLADNLREKKELEDNSQLCEDRLIRADKLISGLEEERVRWVENVEIMQSQLDSVLGDVLVSSGSVAYLGPFTEEYRSNLVATWIKNLDINGVPHTADPSLITTFGDPVKIRNWQIAGLPKDNLSVQNGVIAQFSQRWALFIDPQGQANKWIKNMDKDAGLIVFKMADKDALKRLENAIRYGKPALMEHIGADIDPSLDPVLLKQTFRQEGNVMMKLGENVIPYDANFKLYMTTKLPNPHYAPEVSIKVTILNFTLAPSGLEDQMLAIVVAEERQDLEEAKNELIINTAKMRKELKELEDQILLRLNASEGNPVDDVEFIEILEASKKKSAEIKARVSIAEATEKSIDETRSRYIPVAVRAQILFFCMSGLSVIDPMYQYSLEWFQVNFVASIKDAERSPNLAIRIENINAHFTFNLFTSVCRSLFEKHKLMFAFLMATRIQMNRKLIDMAEWRFLLAGGNPIEMTQNPNPKWISERSWNEILSLAVLPTYQSIITFFKEESDQFEIIFDAVEPHRTPFPDPWEEQLSIFQKLLILRALRPDKVMNAFQDYVAAILGQRFIEPQTNDLMSVFKESSATIPLVFVLSAGTDPGGDLNKFAEKMKFGKKLGVISLGQGQGPRAENMMGFAMEAGQWVFLQNCHLAPSWMPTFERLVEQINPDVVHVDFRLWATSMPSPDFPVYILQNGCKMTVEPPRGIKANLLKVYYDITDDYLESCTRRIREFKYLLLSLALFHSVLVERRKFGSIGFNIAYDFTDGDLNICISQLFMFLTEYEEIAFKVLKYTAGEVNYGGRVTDDWDRRTVMNILEGYYRMEVLNKNYAFDSANIYHQMDPETTFVTDYTEFIRGLPINDNPDIFGLHDNANIVYAQNELFLNLNYLLLQQPKTIGGQQGGASREDIIEASAMHILDVILEPFQLEPIQDQYPIAYEEAMNTVLIQELLRYNKILREIHTSLKSLLKALKGLLVMTDKLEETSTSLFNNLVPETWKKKSYPSLKPLASWVTDLKARMNFFSNWVDRGTPHTYWISGLWFPQAFLTGTTQNFARRKKIEIDKVSFGFEVLREPKEKLRRPEIGCYVYGLYIEGARWDPQLYYLVEANAKELFTEMPCFWFVPTENREPPTGNIYVAPVYKTLKRAGTLTTSGHSTNFILPVEIPSNNPQSHWVKRSVALICALDY